MSKFAVHLIRVKPGHKWQAKEMVALFGGFNETVPLYRLTLRNFSSRVCLATLCKSFRFFPNLRQLSLGQFNMDE